jgi:hypothetical protein
LTAAERKAALLLAGADATTLTDRLLYGLLVETIEAREDAARREERRLKDAGTIPSRATATPASAPRSSPSGGSRPAPGTYKFGRRKGELLNGSPPADLAWYANAIRESLDDPEKQKYRKYNVEHLAEVEAAQESVVPSEAGQGSFGDGSIDDSDIPF